MAVALVAAALFGVVGLRPAAGQVTAVKGSAFGFRVFSLSLFGGAQPDFGPAPTVTLPAGGSATPVTATAPSADASVTPARFFTSGQLDVSTQGTTTSGSVTSTARVANINTSQQEILTAAAVESTCTANSTGVSGATTLTGGSLQIDSGLDVNGDGDYTDAGEHPPVSEALPATPAANREYMGHIHLSSTSQDTFRVVFNEQVVNGDGSITVNAVHEYLLGPVAKGEVIVGQVVCGITGTAATTTSTTTGASTTSTTAGATTTTTAGATTTTTAASTTTTTTASPTTTTSASTTTTTSQAGTALGGGAYGYFTSVGLFGGAAATRGPEPSVTLPAAGADPPLTATLPSARAAYGPAEIFTSGKIDVSTQGTAGAGGSARSSASLTDVGPGPFVAQSLSSTCTASSTGRSGSVTVTGGKITTSEGANLDSEADDTIVQVAASPAPNTSFEGKLESIGDSFRIVVNEQTVSGGSITVNAVHMYLLGPTAVGEAIIGQSRCGATATTTGPGGGQSASVTGSGTAMVRTGSEAATMVAFALVLAVGGSTVTFWSQGLRDRRRGRPMPWSRHRALG
jgi:hypothetical protein